MPIHSYDPARPGPARAPEADTRPPQARPVLRALHGRPKADHWCCYPSGAREGVPRSVLPMSMHDEREREKASGLRRRPCCPPLSPALQQSEDEEEEEEEEGASSGAVARA